MLLPRWAGLLRFHGAHSLHAIKPRLSFQNPRSTLLSRLLSTRVAMSPALKTGEFIGSLDCGTTFVLIYVSCYLILVLIMKYISVPSGSSFSTSMQILLPNTNLNSLSTTLIPGTSLICPFPHSKSQEH